MSALNVIALAFVSILLAAALEPFVGWLRAHTPIPRGGTVLLVYAGFFLAVAVFAVLVLPAAITQAEGVISRLPGFLDEVEAWASTTRSDALERTVRSLVQAAREMIAPAPPPGPDEVVEAGLTLAEILGSVGTVLTLVFFWLVGHARLQRYVLAFVPMHRRAGWRDAWNEIESRLGMWVRGQLILMAAVGILCGAAYFVLGVPSALLLGLIAALCEAIPMVGPILGAIPAVLAAATVSPELALLVVGVTAAIQILENNVLVPVVMRNTIGLSPLIVLLSLMFGGALGGLLGALVAVPLVAAIEVIVGRLQAREVPVAQEPVTSVGEDAEHETPRQTVPDARAAAG
jgi:predicted PurR-regulated permease PerM